MTTSSDMPKTTSTDETGKPQKIIDAVHISKAFGSTRALDDVTIAGHAGEVHAITGENGAGKSTFMKILAGAERPDDGKIVIRGRETRLNSARDALNKGISSVFQESTLLPNLTIAENMYLGRELARHGFLQRREMSRRTQKALDRVGLDIDPGTPAGTLTVGEQQLLEIAKGISTDASVFFFDEPTAALNKPEVDRLEKIIFDLRARGKTIFYISHRLEEIFRFCDTVSVLKDGCLVSTVPKKTLTEEKLVALMVGRDIGDLFPPRAEKVSGAALDVRCLMVSKGAPDLKLQLQCGEILGLAGLEGQGQREILRCLAGVQKPFKSDIRTTTPDGGTSLLAPEKGVAACLNSGIGFIPENRQTEGLFMDLSIYENISIGRLFGLGLIRPTPKTGPAVKGMFDRLHLQARGLRAPVSSLRAATSRR